MKQTSNTGARRAYTPNMDAPSKEKRSRRGLGALLLVLILPPVGLAYMWRCGVFRTRGRMLLTAIGTLVMALWCVALAPSEVLHMESPVPITPAAVTAAPDDGVVLALSNLDQLLEQRQAEMDAAAGITPEPMATDDPQYLAEQAAIYQSTVYSVYGNSAKFYHSKTVCGTQSNRRVLTVKEAMELGMGACPNCDPPVYIGPLHN